ncbi:hypothetical protein AAFF_G00032140 [Aldrovandia affinis]|uniref:Uncharacterized protein n=1 Tax=Aldrovandia affinis TaxID=143900 RepID=A0AAD7S3X2_9TELE|nr:hypothetical protein AAFF_G00032140 [Aldrovandia affinis]
MAGDFDQRGHRSPVVGRGGGRLFRRDVGVREQSQGPARKARLRPLCAVATARHCPREYGLSPASCLPSPFLALLLSLPAGAACSPATPESCSSEVTTSPM